MKVAQTLPVVALLASSAAATGWFPACDVCLSMSPPLDFKLTSNELVERLPYKLQWHSLFLQLWLGLPLLRFKRSRHIEQLRCYSLLEQHR